MAVNMSVEEHPLILMKLEQFLSASYNFSSGLSSVS